MQIKIKQIFEIRLENVQQVNQKYFVKEISIYSFLDLRIIISPKAVPRDVSISVSSTEGQFAALSNTAILVSVSNTGDNNEHLNETSHASGSMKMRNNIH